MKKLVRVLLFTVSFVLLLPLTAFAQAAPDYVIKSEEITIQVNEDNTYDISKKITADFSQSVGETHGITETVPVDMRMRRMADGQYEESGAHAVVTDLKANVPCEISREGSDVVIRLGDTDETVTGVVEYEYSYRFDMGPDTLSGADEFYYNLVSPENTIPIERLTFTIEMPKAFDTGKLGFTTGSEQSGTYDESALTYMVEGNTIRGEMAKTVESGYGVNVRAELPDGYYVGARSTIAYFMPAFCAGGTAFVLVLILLVASGKRRAEVETVEFGPPEGMNSADVGYIIDGETDNRDVVSLLIFWADKGFIEIHQPDEKNMKMCIRDRDKNNDQYYLAKALCEQLLGEDAHIVSKFTGKELEYKEYEPLFDFARTDEKAWYITCDTYVTLTDGSGIVHIAPCLLYTSRCV